MTTCATTTMRRGNNEYAVEAYQEMRTASNVIQQMTLTEVMAMMAMMPMMTMAIKW